MHKWIELGLAVLVGAVLPAGTMIYQSGRQSVQMDDMRSRIEKLEKRAGESGKIEDPVKVKCAALADQLAKAGDNIPQLQAAMEALACFRSN